MDLMFVEYLVNDAFNGNTKSYEKLLRRILNLPNKPAVVLVQVRCTCRHGQSAWTPWPVLMQVGFFCGRCTGSGFCAQYRMKKVSHS